MQKKKAVPATVVTDRLVVFSKEVPSVVDPSHLVDYSKRETPPNYKCSKCDATSCKLWREYQTLLKHQSLFCAKCAAKDQKEDISDIDADGRRKLEDFGGRTDQIGWYIPAVPAEENDTYWGYTSVPQAGCDWWRNLPTPHKNLPIKNLAPFTFRISRASRRTRFCSGLFFIFEQKLPYNQIEGYRTDKIPCATTLFEEFAMQNPLDVEMGGIDFASFGKILGAPEVKTFTSGFPFNSPDHIHGTIKPPTGALLCHGDDRS